MEYEYVALACEDISALAGAGPMFVAQFASRKTHGWELFVKAPWHTTGVLCRTGVVIMRRPKDEPRKWTKAEIKKIAALVMDCRVPVLNERAMQADLCGRLERRNAELQTAIREVVNIERCPDLDWSSAHRYGEIQAAIHRFLYPLVPLEGGCCPDYRPDATATG